ncbi:MipA/OmpV family protein [Duganella sp. P38]|uniref:MipA/OmpV family protein n=1 Tax=Duganella sp. P38 TaxID=3423949 RepID=UPI003D7A4FE6
MRHAITLTLLSLCAFSGKVLAEEAAPAAAAQGDTMLAGVGLAYVPEYAGADKSRVLPLPFLEKTYSNGVFLSTRRGLGYQTALGDFRVSAALGYDAGREDHKENYFSGSDALKGMGRINGSTQAVLSVGYQLGSVGLNLSTRQNLGHREYGSTYTLGMETPIYSSASDQFSFSASAEYADRKRMQTYFGVTATQAANTGYRYRAYAPGAGLANVAAGVSWTHVVDRNWIVRSAAGVTVLTGDAADSPLTQRKAMPVLMTALVYKF